MKIIQPKILAIYFAIVAIVLFSFLGFNANASSLDYNLIKSKANLFYEAIEEFGANSPAEAANLWAKGVKTRNGALQFAVMDAKLKKEFTVRMEKEGPGWVTGFSSPWVKNYQIVGTKKENKTQYKITVQFELASSAGSEGKAKAVLSIGKQGNHWVIKGIKSDTKLSGF